MPDSERKSLNTYVVNICYRDMPVPRFMGLKVAVSGSAMREIFKLGKDLNDVIKVLEQGHDAPRKRAKGTIEKWLGRGNKTYNVVIVKDYHRLLNEDVWVVIHFGKFARRK